MVRIKNPSAAFGRKKRIEGIVKNLSEKASKTDENNTELESVLGSSREDMDSISYSLTSTVDPVQTDSYELPAGMQFFGIIASKYLPQGQKFGPFLGNITQTVDPSVLNYSYISQIPDVEGNDYCLNLLKTAIESSKWLNSLERCASHLGYNLIAYNTPTGIYLQTVCDIPPGQQLCVAYDVSYDLPQVVQIPVPAIRTTDTVSPVEKVAEPFVNLRTTVGPDFLARINEQRVFTVELTNHFDNHMTSNGLSAELSDDMKPTYSVMTADVSQTYYPPIEDSKNSSNDAYTRINSVDGKVEGRKAAVDKTYKCSSCKSCFNTMEERQYHMDTAHTAECPICKKVYTRSYLKEHMTFHTESSRVTCTICSKVFSSISNLRKHEKKHSKRVLPYQEKKRLYRCSECKEAFHSQKFLEVHRKKHVLVVPITCQDCGEVFAQKNLLRRHQAVIHKGIRPFSCNYCQKTFTQRGNLVRHCRQAHTERNARDVNVTKKKFLCRRRGCNQAKFSSRDLYIEHLQQHSGNNRIFSCEECICVFSSAGNLSKHRKTIHNGGNNTDSKPTTPAQASTPVVAASVREAPVPKAKYQCAQCQQPFQNHFQLNRHMRVHKEVKKELNTCEKCGKIFMTRSGLSKHIKYLRCVVIKSESNVGPPKSSVPAPSKAPKEVRSTKEIRTSRRESKMVKVAKTDSPFGCTTCGKDFTSAWYLKVHRRSHKSYHVPCELCGKKFSHVTNLAKHMKYIHQDAVPPVVQKSKEKPVEKPKGKSNEKSKEQSKSKLDVVKVELSCETCDKTLANLNSLAVHRQIHNGAKPFECGFCGTRFTQKCNMKRHLGTCKSAKEHQHSIKNERLESPARSRSTSGVNCEQPSSPMF